VGEGVYSGPPQGRRQEGGKGERGGVLAGEKKRLRCHGGSNVGAAGGW